MRADTPKYAFREFLLPKDEHPQRRHQHKLGQLQPSTLAAICDAAQSSTSKDSLQLLTTFYSQFGIVIRPQNIFLLIWDAIIIAIVIFFILEIGFLIGFGDQFWRAEMNNILGLHVLFVLMLLLDILISPIKAHYKEGLLVTDVSVILRSYLDLEVFIDVSAWLAVIIPLLVDRVDSNWLKMVWLVKFYTVSRINVQFQRVTQLYITLNTTYLCIKLAVILIIYAHYMGIAFYMVSYWIYRNNYYGPNTPNLCWIYNSWAFYNMTLILSWSQMYTYIMYFSIAVVTTIAYGDITPKNPIECIFMIFILITISIILGYLMTEILRLLINVFSYNYERKHNHFQLINKLKSQNVRAETTSLIRAHTEEIDREEQFRNRQVEDQILHFLPPGPLYGLLLVIYRRFLGEIGLEFALDAVPESVRVTGNRSLFLENFMREIKEQRQFVGDIVYQCGEKWDSKEGGHAAYFFTKKEYEDSVTLGVGELPKMNLGRADPSYRNSFPITTAHTVYGQVQFLSGQARSHWAICLKNCVVFTVGREVLFRHYHLLTQKQKQALAVRMQSAQEIDCYICNRNHYFLRCPFCFLNIGSLIRQDRKVLRKRMHLKMNRTRLKTQSSWTIFSKIRRMKMKLSKEYKERLMANRTTHSLFVEHQLAEETSSSEEQEFQDRLHELEVIIGRVYVDYAGVQDEDFQVDCVYNFKDYRVYNNIAEIEKDMNHRDRRMADFKNVVQANIMRMFQ